MTRTKTSNDFLRIDASFLFACHFRFYTYQAIGSGSERPPHKNTICLILWTLLCGPVLSPAQLSNARTYASAPSCSSQLKMVDTVKKKYLPGAGEMGWAVATCVCHSKNNMIRTMGALLRDLYFLLHSFQTSASRYPHYGFRQN